MSRSVRPHRQQPTRLSRPWDSPGKNTGVGCHFLLQCMKVNNEREVAQSCPTLHNPVDRSLPGSSVHGIFQARVLEWAAIASAPYQSPGLVVHNHRTQAFVSGEGNGTPLQYSCLQNPMDGAAWWAIQSMGSLRVRHD